MSDPLTRNFCVIGDPIGHSLSPVIHRFIFNALGVDRSYDAVLVSPENLRRFVEESRQSGRPGFNLTIPHKQAVIPFLDRLDPTAERVGAVNTVQRDGSLLLGFNTDVHGCLTALGRAGFKPGGGTTVLFGAGGAARAAAEALASLGIGTLHLIEIDRPRLDRFKSELEASLGLRIIPLLSDDILKSVLERSELIVNATPVGMWPKSDRSPIRFAERIPPSSLVFDMVFNPVETLLLRQAKSRGARTVPGLVMLVAQAVAADEIWLDRTLPEKLHADVFTHCLKHMEAHGSASDTHRG
jgi:shikimate dehydrogenase